MPSSLATNRVCVQSWAKTTNHSVPSYIHSFIYFLYINSNYLADNEGFKYFMFQKFVYQSTHYSLLADNEVERVLVSDCEFKRVWCKATYV